MSDQRPTFLLCFAVWLVAAIDAFWLGWSKLPCPRGVDDAFYKSPAAELVQTGRLTQPAVIGYLPRAGEVFAAYPPLYQLCVAGWFALFGVSTAASVAFGHVLHLFNMAAIMALVAAALRPIALSAGLRALAIAAPGVVFFGILRFFDRQEELAVLFGFVEMILVLHGRLRGVRGAALTGFLVGLSGVVSPWAGAVLGGIVFLREMIDRSQAAQWQGMLGRLVVIVGTALLPAAVWVGWLEVVHPGSISQVFLYHLGISEHRTIFDAPERAWSSVQHAPYALPAIIFTAVFFPRLLGTKERGSVPAGILALFLGGMASLAFVLVTRANSYNYVWLCLFLILPCFGYIAGRLLAEAGPAERFLPTLMVLMCVTVSLRDPMSLSMIAQDLPAEEREGPIFARLAEAIPPGEPVATTSRYWYFFQGRNPWRVSAIYPHLSEQERRTWVKWIVIPVSPGSEEENQKLTEGFERVAIVPSEYETFAPSFNLEDRTWAYELYRRREGAGK